MPTVTRIFPVLAEADLSQRDRDIINRHRLGEHWQGYEWSPHADWVRHPEVHPQNMYSFNGMNLVDVKAADWIKPPNGAKRAKWPIEVFE